MSRRKTVSFERVFRAPLDDVWELWTTKEGIESWWGPDGFAVEVESIDLRPGGEMLYRMFATGKDQIEFMKRAGMPVSVPHRITYKTIEPKRRLAYAQLADFIPGVDPYDVDLEVTLTVDGDQVKMVVVTEVMHDETWTGRAVAGWNMELDKLVALFAD
jgi:uncharacterized protein YndB with AHSA1/START domain